MTNGLPFNYLNVLFVINRWDRKDSVSTIQFDAGFLLLMELCIDQRLRMNPILLVKFIQHSMYQQFILEFYSYFFDRTLRNASI